jgi:hypothetical protein
VSVEKLASLEMATGEIDVRGGVVDTSACSSYIEKA